MRLAAIVVALASCKGDERKPPVPWVPPKPVAPAVDRTADAKLRNDALMKAPFETRVTDKKCTLAYPRSGDDLIEFTVDEIANPPMPKNDRGLETLVIQEGGGIGRVYVWDRGAKKYVCGGAFQGSWQAAVVYELVDTASTFPKPPDHMRPREGKKVKQVSTGEHHTCALLEDGTVRCFGQNDAGQCGAAKENIVGKPHAVEGVKGAVEISAGTSSTCARFASGAIQCWGDLKGNWSIGATQLAATSFGACAMRGDGGVMCWDSDEHKVPSKVKQLGAAAEICSGGMNSCARLRAGGIACWGPYYGEDPPMTIEGSDGAATVDCGSNATEVCWSDKDHVAHCFDGRKAVDLPTLKDVVHVQFGWDHACAQHVDGTVSCWGKNEFGQLGDGTQVPEPKPRPIRPVSGTPKGVIPLRGVKQLEIGAQRTAVILEDDGLATWGYGPIGDGRDCSGPPCDGLIPTQIDFR